MEEERVAACTMGNRSSQKSVWTASKGTRKHQIVLASDLFLKAWALSMTNEEAVMFRSIFGKGQNMSSTHNSNSSASGGSAATGATLSNKNVITEQELNHSTEPILWPWTAPVAWISERFPRSNSTLANPMPISFWRERCDLPPGSHYLLVSTNGGD